jgi:hypothetical protein
LDNEVRASRLAWERRRCVIGGLFGSEAEMRAVVIAAAVAAAGINGWGLMNGNVSSLDWGAGIHGPDALQVDTT